MQADSFMPDPIADLAAGYVMGNLTDHEMALFQSMLRHSPYIQQQVERLTTTFDLLGHTAPDIAPPASLKTRLLQTITPPSQPHFEPFSPREHHRDIRRTRWRSRPDWRRWRILGLAFLVALLLSLGLNNWYLGHQLRVAEGQLEQQTANLQTVLANADPSMLLITSSAEWMEGNWDAITRLLADSRRVQQAGLHEVMVQSAHPQQVWEQLQDQIGLPSAAKAIASADVTLLGGSPCDMGSLKGLRFTYQLGEAIANFYQLWPAAEAVLPALDATALYMKGKDNERGILWQDKATLYSIVGRLPIVELERLTTQLVPIASLETVDP